MSLFTIGRLCMKIAGRDAGKKCVVIEQLDNTFVMVDGQTRRKKVNMKHLEPFGPVLEIKENASPEEVKAAFKELGLEVRETHPKSVLARVKPQKKGKEKKAASAEAGKSKK